MIAVGAGDDDGGLDVAEDIGEGLAGLGEGSEAAEGLGDGESAVGGAEGGEVRVEGVAVAGDTAGGEQFAEGAIGVAGDMDVPGVAGCGFGGEFEEVHLRAGGDMTDVVDEEHAARGGGVHGEAG